MTLFDSPEASVPVLPQASEPVPSSRLRMRVAYDGRGFHGFSVQPGRLTVGARLGSVLARVLSLPEPPVLTCAGRTDAGVHAWGQVVHCDVPRDRADRDLGGLQRRLVKLLAPNVVVRSVELAPAGWDARRSALWRLYRYRVLNRPVPDPFVHGQVWQVERPLALRSMQLGCDALIGEHDFSSFCRKPAQWPSHQEASLVRRVLDASWRDVGEGELRFDIQATAFCQQMVRSVVGTLVEVGLGKRRAGEMAGILRAGDRAAAGPVAPAEGLCLWEVGYPAE